MAARLGLIGYGAWGGCHARAIAGLDGLELAAIAARSEASLARARKDFPDAFVTADYRELLARDEVEIVDVVVPNHLHEECGVAALEAGKHVLLEKPMATSAKACDRLVAAAEASGKVLSIGHELRLSTQWGKIKQEIDAGRLGRPRFVNINLFRNHYRTGADGWRYDPDRVGSWILEEAVHFFDFALWYLEDLGDPVAVTACGTLKGEGDGMHDNFTALIRYREDAYAVVTQCIAGFEHNLTIEVTGTEGAIRAAWSGAMDRDESPFYSLKIRPKGFDFERGVRESERIDVEPSGEVFELVEQIRLTVEAMQAGRPLVSGDEGRKRVLLCLAAQESARTGKEVPVSF